MKKNIIETGITILLCVFFTGCAREMSRSNPLDPTNIPVASVISNNLPSAPAAAPTGSSAGTILISYTYSISAADLDGDQVKYRFDWGDGTTSDSSLVNSGVSASASHSWSTANTYSVKAKTIDSKGGVSASWSPVLNATINSGSNSLPNAPASAPTGTGTCLVSTSYTYSASATDPDGDQVKYRFDWGDGTTSDTGLVNSGVSASASHSWPTTNVYSVKAKTIDSHGALSSSWSPALSVTVGSGTETPINISACNPGLETWSGGTSFTNPSSDSTYTADTWRLAWTGSLPCVVSREGTLKSSGSYSGKITTASSGVSASNFGYYTVYAGYAAYKGKTVRMKADVYCSVANKASIVLVPYSDRHGFERSAYVALANTWTPLSVDLLMPSDANNLQIHFGCGVAVSNNEIYIIDNIRLYEVTPYLYGNSQTNPLYWKQYYTAIPVWLLFEI